MKIFNSIASIVLLIQLTSALHFYATPFAANCFYEELAKGTVVIGKFDAYVSDGNEFKKAPELKLEETFDNDHRVVSQKSNSNGEITFSALDSGEHKFCITPIYTDRSTKVRVFFDLVMAGSEIIDSQRKDEVSILTNKVKQLTNKVEEIKREQQLFRVSVIKVFEFFSQILDY
ncbi:hypothetical protein WICMUC_004371 [Wickerhamomyces mucosus]|uniref:GOLD domain-containing protein n=1 Tax=Wickerhamomyces mucosus TaxID=1378264 RepID=A0A9P8TBK8_9ASCO|nr:hypothetical protein WICMUC_004371 [Wickerhamomyces mucosus]